jgi:hypothetical protein
LMVDELKEICREDPRWSWIPLFLHLRARGRRAWRSQFLCFAGIGSY